MRHWGAWAVAALSLNFVTVAAAQTVKVDYTYDAKGRLAASRTWIPTVTSGIGCYDWTTSYTYDAVDNRTRLVMAKSGCFDTASIAPIQVMAGLPVEIDVASVSGDRDVGRKILTSADGAAKGKLTLTNGRVLYAPDAGQSGADSFTYTLTDGAVTDKATIRVDILNVAIRAHAPLLR